MVKFKPLKFKHFRQARELNSRIDAGEADDADILLFAASLVEEWDFVDVETGKAIPLGEIDELTLDQCAQINTEFARKMGVSAEVPKESAGQSPSTLTQ